jgi:hypothetical protein
MDAEPLSVVIHDGDLKSGERCDDSLFEERLAVFQSSLHPSYSFRRQRLDRLPPHKQRQLRSP